jgi:hypothetical protein
MEKRTLLLDEEETFLFFAPDRAQAEIGKGREGEDE